MNAFMEMGFNTFMDGISSGLPPEAAATAAGEAMGTAATDLGFPPDMVADGVASGMETFNQAMADGLSPTDAFGAAVADVPPAVVQAFDAGTMEGISPDTMSEFNADMMDAMPPEAMAGMSAPMMEAMPPMAMGGMSAPMM